MSVIDADLEKKVRLLPIEQKGALARLLIRDLDTETDSDVEQAWLEESEKRLAAFRNGEIAAVPGDEAISRVRQRLK